MTWWMWDTLGALLAAVGAGWLRWRQEKRTQEQWRAVGLDSGKAWPIVVGNAAVFACVGFALTNSVLLALS